MILEALGAIVMLGAFLAIAAQDFIWKRGLSPRGRAGKR